MDILSSNTPQKQCSKCGYSFPATPEYFHRLGDGLRPECKKCREVHIANPKKGGRPRKTRIASPSNPVRRSRNGNKPCSRCGETDSTKFSVGKNGYRRYTCKKCDSLQTREWANKNRDTYIAGMKRWREANPHYHLKSAYGLSESDYWQMLVSQNNACLICKQYFDERKKPHVDHCHSTGKVRGLLCPTCNQGLGLFQDNPKWLREAANYLGNEFPD